MIRGEIVPLAQTPQDLKRGTEDYRVGLVLDDDEPYRVLAERYPDGVIEITVRASDGEVVERGQTRRALDVHRWGADAGVEQGAGDAALPEDGRDIELLYRHARQYPEDEIPVRSRRDGFDAGRSGRELVADVDGFYEEHAEFYGE